MALDVRRIADPQDLYRWQQMVAKKSKHVADEAIGRPFQNVSQSIYEYYARMLKYSPSNALRANIAEVNIPNELLANAAKQIY